MSDPHPIVVLIEDEPQIRRLLRTVLPAHGIEPRILPQRAIVELPALACRAQMRERSRDLSEGSLERSDVMLKARWNARENAYSEV